MRGVWVTASARAEWVLLGRCLDGAASAPNPDGVTGPRPPFSTRAGAGVRALAGSRLAWVVVVSLAAAWPVVWSLRTSMPRTPPVLRTVPPFELTDERGHPFGSRDLAGRVWVASLVFTRCETVCPRVTATMARIQDRTRGLGPALHLVSFSVDPEHDTPARLAAYARSYRASPRMWTFLTGSGDAVRRTVEQGLRVSVGSDPTDPSPAGISHGSHLVLVDGAGGIRGYYDPEDPRVVEQVVRDAALLVNRGAP